MTELMVFLVVGWYRHMDGIADFYDVALTEDQAKQLCRRNLIEVTEDDDSEIEWQEKGNNLTQGFYEFWDGDYIYEVIEKRLTLND